MKPLGRRGFGLAMLGCLFAAILVGLHVARDSAWTAWPRRVLPEIDPMTADILAMQVSVAAIMAMWSWFTARRNLAMMMRRWPAMLPLAFWIATGLTTTAAFEGYDPFAIGTDDPRANLGGPGDPANGRVGDPAQRPERLRGDWMIREYLAMAGLGLAVLSVVAAAWCTASGLRRSPVPVAPHFD